MYEVGAVVMQGQLNCRGVWQEANQVGSRFIGWNRSNIPAMDSINMTTYSATRV